MSQELIDHSEDLKRLEDEGYNIEIKGAYVLLYNVPYVNSEKKIKFGSLVSTLTLSGNITTRPENHVIYFIGEYPCDIDGSKIKALEYENFTRNLLSDLEVNYAFSNKPSGGYNNYYEKFKSYFDTISCHARFLDEKLDAEKI